MHLDACGKGKPIVIPDELQGVPGHNHRLKDLLSLVSIRWMPYKSTKKGADRKTPLTTRIVYPHFQGSVKKIDQENFNGMLGLFWHGGATCAELSEDELAWVTAAIEYLQENNVLYRQLLSRFEAEFGSRPQAEGISPLGVTFPEFDPADITMELADCVENTQQKDKDVGNERVGYFCPVDPINPASHISDLNDVSVGSQTRRDRASAEGHDFIENLHRDSLRQPDHDPNAQFQPWVNNPILDAGESNDDASLLQRRTGADDEPDGHVEDIPAMGGRWWVP